MQLVSNCRQAHVVYSTRLTNNNWGDLRNFADVVIGLHNALDARNGEVVLDDDVVHVGREHGAPTGAIAHVGHLGRRAEGLWYVVGVLHVLAVRAVGRRVRRIRGRRELGCWLLRGTGARQGRGRGRGLLGHGVRDRSSVALVLGMDGRVVGGVVGRQIGRLWGVRVHWPGI